MSASDGGFIQLLSTTTGSSTLEGEAAKHSLGGTYNVPLTLNDLKIRFGELLTTEKEAGAGSLIRRAGFGTGSQIKPLLRGARYKGEDKVLGATSSDEGIELI